MTLYNEICNSHIKNIHCVQKKTPTHIFFHISMNYKFCGFKQKLQ